MKPMRYDAGTDRCFAASGSLAVVVTIITFLFLPMTRRAQAAQGDLDATFGTGGKVVSETAKAFRRVSALALQRKKGKIVVAGYSNGKKGQRAFVGQYLEDGTADVSFGEEGFAGIGSDFAAATAVAVQENGKIVVAGRVGQDFGLARLNKNGSLDLTFGNAGVVATDFLGGLDAAFALALQPDGKIVLVGDTPRGHHDQFGIARYTSEGGLDATFGNRGKVTIDFPQGISQALAVALQPDGKVVVAGMAVSDATHNDFALVRLLPDGRLDLTFGTDGIVTTDFSGGFDTAFAILIQPDGKLVVVGESDFKFGLARYQADGRLDPTFGVGGIRTDSFGVSSYALAAALQADGKIIAVGQMRWIDQNPATDDFAIARYQPDGTLDETFAQGGKMTIDFLGGSDGATALAIQKDGKAVIAGLASGNDSRYAIALARLMGE